MQKKIIALAVAGLMSGAAFAQSNVTIYGNMDVGYLNSDSNSKTTTAGVVTDKDSRDQSSTGFSDGALSTNHIGFRGTEDLGNGLKAHFELELGLTEADYLGADTGADTGGAGSAGTSAFQTRKSNIGLSGAFGSVTLGRQAVLIDNAWAVGSAGMKNNAVGDMYTSRFNDVRANELITYVSPNFSGFTAAVQYGKGKDNQKDTVGAPTSADNEHTNYGFSVNYANGPVAAVFAWNKEKNDALTGTVADPKGGTDFDRDSWILGANYNFGIVRVFGQYFRGDRTDNDWSLGGIAADTERERSKVRGWELGVHVPVTAQLTLAGSYFDTKYDFKENDLVGGVAGADTGSGDGDGFQLAALYAMSKRTTAYVMYGSEDYSERWRVANTKDTADTKQFAIGLKHAF